MQATKRQIVDALGRAGLRRGDHLLVHSSLRKVGPIDGGADALIDGLLEVVGEDGTLAMPAFNTTRYLPTPCFDMRLTASRSGMLTEMYRQRPASQRSCHPTHSVVAQGRRAAEFLADHYLREAFGVDSPIDRLARAGGYVLLIGVTHMANSCIHIGESCAGVTKFYWDDGPLPVVKCRLPSGDIIDYELDCTASCSMAFNAVEYLLRKRNHVSDLNVGQALCFLMQGRDIIENVVEMLRERPDFLLCNREICRPCVLARKHLFSR